MAIAAEWALNSRIKNHACNMKTCSQLHFINIIISAIQINNRERERENAYKWKELDLGAPESNALFLMS